MYRAGIRRHRPARVGCLDFCGERIQGVDVDQVVVELLGPVDGVVVELEGRGDGARGGRLHGVKVASAQLCPNFADLLLGIIVLRLLLQGDWGAILTMNSTQLGWSEALLAAGVISVTSSSLLRVVVIRNLLADIAENPGSSNVARLARPRDFPRVPIAMYLN